MLRISTSQKWSNKENDYVNQSKDKNKRMVKSMSREEWSGVRELEEVSDDLRAKSRLLLSRYPRTTRKYFNCFKMLFSSSLLTSEIISLI